MSNAGNTQGPGSRHRSTGEQDGHVGDGGNQNYRNKAPESYEKNFHVGELTFPSCLPRVEFTVGDTPINNFRMIERHYFRDQLLKSFDFEFGFCMPSSKNTCEHIYEFPALSEDISECHRNTRDRHTPTRRRFLLDFTGCNDANSRVSCVSFLSQWARWSCTLTRRSLTASTSWTTSWWCTTRQTIPTAGGRRKSILPPSLLPVLDIFQNPCMTSGPD